MQGVMVVPISATGSSKNAFECRKCGHRRLLTTAPTPGWPRNAAIG